MHVFKEVKRSESNIFRGSIKTPETYHCKYKQVLVSNRSRDFVLDHLCYLCLVLVVLSRLFITALWSPEVKWLTSLVSWDRCGT